MGELLLQVVVSSLITFIILLWLQGCLAYWYDCYSKLTPYFNGEATDLKRQLNHQRVHGSCKLCMANVLLDPFALPWSMRHFLDCSCNS